MIDTIPFLKTFSRHDVTIQYLTVEMMASRYEIFTVYNTIEKNVSMSFCSGLLENVHRW